nr:hypothetical protein [Lachnospiraceae bacterium]
MKKHERRQKTALQQELQKGLQEEIDTQREMNRLYVEDWKAEQERRKKMPREIRIRESIRSVAVIVTILLTFHLLGLSSNLQGDSETRVLTLTFLLPLFFTSCVYGFVTGISCYGVIFLLQFIYNPDTAYTATLLMVTVLLGSYGVAQGFFRTKKRMLCYFLILCVMIGSLYYFLYGLIARKTFDDFSLIGGLLGMTLILPQLLFGCIVVYLFYRHLPENLIPYFPERGFYRAEQEVTSVWETIRKHRYRVSGKLMTIIVSEAIFLGMMTVTFANFLIPNMNIISTESAESTEEVQVNKDLLKQWETLFNSSMGVENGEVSLDKASDQTNLIMDLNFWVFDIKLMLMLLNLIVPLTVIANLIAQRIFAKPIIEMNTALEKYSQEEEISKYVEKIDALEIHT